MTSSGVLCPEISSQTALDSPLAELWVLALFKLGMSKREPVTSPILDPFFHKLTAIFFFLGVICFNNLLFF